MEEAILRRDFQTFAKLTMQVQLDCVHIWNRVYLHDSNIKYIFCTFLYIFELYLVCLHSPPSHTHLLMYSVRVEIWRQ